MRVWAVLRQEIGERFVAKAGKHEHRPTLEALAPSVNALYELEHEAQQGHVLAPLARAHVAAGLGSWASDLSCIASFLPLPLALCSIVTIRR